MKGRKDFSNINIILKHSDEELNIENKTTVADISVLKWS